jgi:hypothetical protein
MTVSAPAPLTAPDSDEVPRARPGRREARARRRDAARAARTAAARAELHGILGVLVQARALLGQGWVQGTWFAVRPAGQPDAADAPGPTRTGAPPATCLVGAVVLAAGGRSAVRAQPTQRSLDLLWHTLHRAGDPGPVRWCPAPALRTLQVQDLTRWNDAPGRTVDQVVALLDAAIGRLAAELRIRVDPPAAGPFPVQPGP